jgi:hypothetical protein
LHVIRVCLALAVWESASQQARLRAMRGNKVGFLEKVVLLQAYILSGEPAAFYSMIGHGILVSS